jgi:hypothetical protein
MIVKSIFSNPRGNVSTLNWTSNGMILTLRAFDERSSNSDTSASVDGVENDVKVELQRIPYGTPDWETLIEKETAEMLKLKNHLATTREETLAVKNKIKDAKAEFIKLMKASNELKTNSPTNRRHSLLWQSKSVMSKRRSVCSPPKKTGKKGANNKSDIIVKELEDVRNKKPEFST